MNTYNVVFQNMVHHIVHDIVTTGYIWYRNPVIIAGNKYNWYISQFLKYLIVKYLGNNDLWYISQLYLIRALTMAFLTSLKMSLEFHQSWNTLRPVVNSEFLSRLACGHLFLSSFPWGPLGVPPKIAMEAIFASDIPGFRMRCRGMGQCLLHLITPICSMVLVYLPTFAQDKSPSHVGKYTSTMEDIGTYYYLHLYSIFWGNEHPSTKYVGVNRRVPGEAAKLDP